MSGELVIPPTGGTSADGNNVIKSSSTSGTAIGSGTISGTTSAAFHTASVGPFSYGIPPISRPSNYFGASHSFYSHNTAGASSSKPFNIPPR